MGLYEEARHGQDAHATFGGDYYNRAMKILITADLHYDIARSRRGTEDLARRACEAGGDAIVLAGDSAGADLEVLRGCLRLFADFPGRRLLVPGNHCLWCREGENSMDRYERLLPEVAGEEGFAVLDHQPVVLRDERQSVLLVGSIGWYDYSFADKSLGLPEAFYRAKVAPGAANYYEEHRHLVEAHREVLTERHLEMSGRWMDGVHVRLGMSDEEFVELLEGRLRGQLAEWGPRVDRVVAFMHHVPFGAGLPQGRPDRFAFAAAYMGSPRLGRVLLDCEKVSHVYCGHSHWPDSRKVGSVNVINVGSTYIEKRLVTLEL